MLDSVLVAAPASVTVTRRSCGVLVSAVGEFDLATAPLLREALEQACHDCGTVRLDMSQVSFIDASTVGEMVAARNDLARSGCRIEIVQPSARVVRILRLTGMDDFLPDTIDSGGS